VSGKSPRCHATTTWRLAIPAGLSLVLALTASAASAGADPAGAAPAVTGALVRPVKACGSYQCFYYAKTFWRSVPSPKPGQRATVPLAARAVRAAPGAPRMLVGLDNGPWSFWDVSDGFAQGRSGVIGGVPAGNVFNFSHWQYVDELYYYLHETVSVPPTQWVNAAHRNGVPVLGTVTPDCTLCGPQAAQLFTLGNYQKTVRKLYQYATAYRFDGWMIDIEGRDLRPGPGLLRAVRELCRMTLPDGHRMRVALYHGAEYSLGAMLPYVRAGAQWQSDYGGRRRLAAPARTYRTLRRHRLQGLNLEAFWASYVYAFQHACRQGHRTTTAQIWNGNRTPGMTPQCLSTARLFAIQRAIVPASRGPGTPPYYTSAGLFAPIWPFAGNLPDKAAPASRARAHAADDALWVGYGVRYSGRSCRRSGTRNAVSALISPRSVVGSLPFVTNFNQGEGDVYAVQGKTVAAAPWNNLSAQDVLPTWDCAVSGSLRAAPVYAAPGNGDSFNGGSALRLSGSAGQADLYATRIRVSASARPVLAFASKTERGAPPYVRVSYSDGTGDTVRTAAAGPRWQQTVSPLHAAGKTITAISVGERGGGPVDTLLGQIRLYDARHDTTPTPITVRSAAPVITWPRAGQRAVAYWNVYLAAPRCLRFLGPAFTNRYAVRQPMFPSGQRTGRYLIQPVSVTGSAPQTGPQCPAHG
jgi:Glycosyl hydrolase family 85